MVRYAWPDGRGTRAAREKPKALRFSSFLLSAVAAVIGGFLPKAANQLLPPSNLGCKPAKFAYQSQPGQTESNQIKPK
jgi:hypothetical protein